MDCVHKQIMSSLLLYPSCAGTTLSILSSLFSISSLQQVRLLTEMSPFHFVSLSCSSLGHSFTLLKHIAYFENLSFCIHLTQIQVMELHATLWGKISLLLLYNYMDFKRKSHVDCLASLCLQHIEIFITEFRYKKASFRFSLFIYFILL